jgi:ABC-type multidrug transport system fused ATPase/permease subunit
LNGPVELIVVDDFAQFHDRYVLLERKITQALDIAKRALPVPPSSDTPQDPESGAGEAEVDEIAAIAGLTVDAVRAELPSDMVISDDVLAEAVTALRSGKHLLLGGPPGTGKSTLAEALCRAVLQDQYDVATGTVLAATLFAHEPEAFREHGSAGLYDHGGPLAASMSTISPG